MAFRTLFSISRVLSDPYRENHPLSLKIRAGVSLLSTLK